MSIAELASQAGMSALSLAKVECGQIPALAMDDFRISRVLDVEIEKFPFDTAS